jgi:hypothetical protein
MARAIRSGVAALLLLSALAVLAQLHALGQTRYFTVDEFQFGHASWLVSQGRVPYVDFYEHHFPASYVLHAPLVAGDAPFVVRALRLRSASFAWLVALSLALAGATGVVLRDPLAALLAAQLPLCFGFSALSAIDYRADNFAGVAWIACLAALEVSRRRRSPWLSAAAGVLLAVAVLSTQKLLLLGGLPVAIWLGWDALSARRRGRAGATPWIAAPAAFLLGGGVVTALALSLAAALGMLGPGWESTVLHAFGHEEHYPAVDLLAFVRPFLSETAVSTALLLPFALLGLASREGRFYALPFAVAVAFGLSIRGKFPYNYLVPCVLGVLLAVRGYVWLLRWVSARGSRLARFAPLLYLLPLLLVPDQLGFAKGRTPNTHQLHVLEKIERFSAPDDVVIDDAGGALFRHHAGYVWYHGPAHRAVLAAYFAGPHLRELRESRAPLWIRDFRLPKLSEATRRYFREHYVRADGWLYALGFAVPGSGEPTRRSIDVVRAGTWYAYPAPAGEVAVDGTPHGVFVDGRPVGAEGLHLDEGQHVLRVDAGSAPVLLTPLPRGLFLDRFPRMRPYSLLFEYERKPARAWRDRTLLTP